MRPLITTLVGLTLAASLWIGGLIIAAHTAPYQIDWLDGGSARCGLPCWYGITPGVTSFSEATRLVRTIPTLDQTSLDGKAAEYTSSLWFALDAADGRIEVQLTGRDSARVESIAFYPMRIGNRTTIQLAALIARFGAPQRITAPSRENALYHYQYALANVEVLVFVPRQATARRCNRLSATAAVYLGPIGTNLIMKRWGGFTNLYSGTCGQTS